MPTRALILALSLGLATPAAAPRCEGERILAEAARDRMRALMSGRVEIVRGEPKTGRTRDRYRRTLGTMMRLDAAPGLPAGDVQADMLKRGLALPWETGAAAKEWRRAFWCGETR